jgi:hypothetical protein
MMKVFLSYAHADGELQKELNEHLGVLRHEKIIDAWYDGQIVPGNVWNEDIARHLTEADLILLLISSAFLNSIYCYENEMRRAIERHEAGTARVIPIILRPCHWKPAPFAKLQGLPEGMLPVTEWSALRRDAVWAEVAKGIHLAAQSWIIDQERKNRSNPVQAEERGNDIGLREGLGDTDAREGAKQSRTQGDFADRVQESKSRPKRPRRIAIVAAVPVATALIGVLVSWFYLTPQFVSPPMVTPPLAPPALPELMAANIAFNNPARMTAGRAGFIQVKLSTPPSPDLKAQLTEAGTRETDNLRVGNRISATLNGGVAFDVSPSTSQVQSISPQQVTSWTWIVTPKISGRQSLILNFDAIIRPGGKDEETKINTLTRPIEVDVGIESPNVFSEWFEFLKKWFENERWWWATLGLLIGLFIWYLLKSIRRILYRRAHAYTKDIDLQVPLMKILRSFAKEKKYGSQWYFFLPPIPGDVSSLAQQMFSISAQEKILCILASHVGRHLIVFDKTGIYFRDRPVGFQRIRKISYASLATAPAFKQWSSHSFLLPDKKQFIAHMGVPASDIVELLNRIRHLAQQN